VRIQVLPDHVANQIAAGEVVERPASVVRELVDNSLDAGATDITVTLEQGGQVLLAVTDDGCGMGRDDALLAFERHATSKLREADDLLAIATLGFRGEALPSIASVAKVTLTTRDAASETATRINIDGGTVRNVERVAAPVGTTIEVRHLFFNTPARRKFLKSPRSEELRIKQWLSAVAIPHPAVRFRLMLDGREVLNIPRRSDVLERGRAMVRGTAVSFTHEGGGIRVAGVVGHPSLAQVHTGGFTIFVNRRLVSDRMLLRAVKEGFDSTLKEREFPVGFLLVDLPPEEVDVNVHPQKAEVRFRSGQPVFVAVREAVLRAVREFRAPLPGTGPGDERGPAVVGEPTPAAVGWGGGAPAGATPAAFAFAAAVPPESPSGRTPTPFRFADLRYVGRVLDCFLIGELEGRLYAVDMHAAHERYNYNLIRNGFRTRSLASQQLLVPAVVNLTLEGAARCLARAEIFERFGFTVESFGEDAVAVRAVPASFGQGNVLGVVREIAAIDEAECAEGRFEEFIDHVAARIACHASVRSGDELSREEVYRLFTDLDRTEFSAACPHGRPVIVSFSRAEVEQWFGRDR